MSKASDKYSGYIDNSGVFFGQRSQKTYTHLPAGVYSLGWNDQVGVLVEPMTSKYDALIDLPSPEYTKVIHDMDTFLKPETKAKFDRLGFVYKRSAMFYGLPGTGKTCLVNRVAEKAITAGAIVFFNPAPGLLEEAYKLIENVEPNRLVLVIFEEFDELLKRNEDVLLSLLDGEIQKNNVMYLATTNYIKNVPARMLRPGRFSSVIEVNYPTLEARLAYLKQKLPNNPNLAEWAASTDGFSVDDLKETVLCVECLGYSLAEAQSRVSTTKADTMRFAEEKENEKARELNSAHKKLQRMLETSLNQSEDADTDY